MSRSTAQILLDDSGTKRFAKANSSGEMLVSVANSTLTVASPSLATSAKQDDALTELQAIVTALQGTLTVSSSTAVKTTMWNNVSVSSGGTSSTSDIGTYAGSHCERTLFGTASAATTLTVQFSHDGTTFYDSDIFVSANGDFSLTFVSACQYIRIKSSASATIMAHMHSR